MRRKQSGFWAGIVLAFVALAAVTQVGVYLKAEKCIARQKKIREARTAESDTSRYSMPDLPPSTAATSATSRYSTDSVAAYEALWPLVQERKDAIMDRICVMMGVTRGKTGRIGMNRLGLRGSVLVWA